jgi:spermidine synthase
VKPWNLIDQTATPDGKTISLHEHDGFYFIRVDGNPLMSTRQHASEERMAELACAHLKAVRSARVLIGGLGFGYTLRAALGLIGKDARVVVAEILSAVIDWNRRPEPGLAADAMADPRVTIVQRDVREVIRTARSEFDSIALDVDNGPAAMSTDGNARLYRVDGLEQTRIALRPGGCAAYWSAAPDTAFARRMERAGFAVEVHHARARGHAGARHTIFLGRVQASASNRTR